MIAFVCEFIFFYVTTFIMVLIVKCVVTRLVNKVRSITNLVDGTNSPSSPSQYMLGPIIGIREETPIATSITTRGNIKWHKYNDH